MERKGKKEEWEERKRTLEKDGWKQKSSSKEGRSRSKLIRESDNVQPQLSATDGSSS